MYVNGADMTRFAKGILILLILQLFLLKGVAFKVDFHCENIGAIKCSEADTLFARMQNCKNGDPDQCKPVPPAMCTAKEKCLLAPCLNGGTCHSGPNETYTCTCTALYSGENCDNYVAGWITLGNSSYYFPERSSKLSKDNSQLTCQAMGDGADLLVIESAEEQELIRTFLQSDPNLMYPTVYLNMYKSTPDILPGTWVNWSTGQTITYNGWGPSRPSYTAKRVGCMVKSLNYQWTDADGWSNYNYICEK